jgi:proline iminopeptidase
VEKFYDAHLVHFEGEPPPFAARSLQNLATSRTYPAMNGPNEFTITGTLKGWDREADLRRIRVPTLILAGELDEAAPATQATLHKGIRGSKLVILPGARHLAMVEQPQAYLAALRPFLARLA